MSHWRDRAACRDLPADVLDEVLYPDPDEGPQDWSRGRRLCEGCPVAGDCLGYSLVAGEQHGMWGGLTEGERARLRRALGFAARPHEVAPTLDGVPADGREHGTYGAYVKHRRLGEDPCRPCRDAKKLRVAEQRRRRREAGRPSARTVDRAREALAAGRLTIDQDDGTAVYRDSAGRVRRLARDAGRWRCQCGADAPACTHVVAVWLALGEAV